MGGTIKPGIGRHPPQRPGSSPSRSERVANSFSRNTHHRLHRHLQGDGKPGQTGVDEYCQVQWTSRVRRFDQASTSVFHQGPRPSAVHRGRMYGCNLYLESGTEKEAWHWGASMYEPATPTSRNEVRSVGFVFDRIASGRTLKYLTNVDHVMHESSGHRQRCRSGP